MAVMFEVVLELAVAWPIHVPGIPITLLRYTLHDPVRPDAELGIAKPLRAAILLERFPGGLERAIGDLDLWGNRLH